jgi:hypothetical protein
LKNKLKYHKLPIEKYIINARQINNHINLLLNNMQNYISLLKNHDNIIYIFNYPNIITIHKSHRTF